MKIRRTILLLVLAAFILGPPLVSTTWAQGKAAEKPEDFYKGKILRIVCSATPGGGTDLAARVIAPYIAKYTGAANVAIENNAAGGGLVAKNYVFNNAKPDGLTMGIDPGSIPVQNFLMDAAGVKYDLTSAPWIANFDDQPWMGLVGAKSQYKSVNDMKGAKGLKFGGATIGGGVTVSSVLVMHLFGLDGKVVTGFKGTTEVALALARGELDGGSGQTSNIKNNMEQGYVRPLVVLEYKRVKELPDVPAITELMEITGEKKELLDAHIMVPTTKMMCVPPGTPQDRVQFLRNAMEKIKEDSQFQAEMEKAMGIKCAWVSIQETEELAKRATEAKKKGVYDKLKELQEKYRK
jgi:tripartite-type tricarboxylate transporter receptor subunit TctC